MTDRAAFAQRLARALDAEAAGEWMRSHALCEEALALGPEDPDALNLLGRLCRVAGDRPRAIALQSFVLHLAPGHPRAAADLAEAREAIASPDVAERLFEQAVALAPVVTCHHQHFLSLWPFVGMERVEAMLREVVSLDPSHAGAHAALGNLQARRQDRTAAIQAYGLATMLRWDFPEAHLALADLLDSIREEAMARRHRVEALARQQLYPACRGSEGAAYRVLVLAAPGGAIENAPLDAIVNPARTALHRYYLVEGAPPAELPPFDVVFNGIEELEASAPAIELARRFVERAGIPAIDRPECVARTRRTELPAALAAVANCTVPPAVRVERARLGELAATAVRVAGTTFPIVVRPVDSHRGDGFERVANGRELEEYLQRRADAAFVVSPFVDYRSEDGYYRKYRVVVVDGRPYPYHLAISDRWMVHYAGSLMPDRAWMRGEEERFLADPASVFERWNEVFPAIGAALGLEFFGVDCTRLPDGSPLVFECNTGMLVHCRDDADLFPYKYRYVPRIFDAFERLLERYSSSTGKPEGA
jgi:glutathione synthase/RimK-type ligase-like ATP-grasp enzyme